MLELKDEDSKCMYESVKLKLSNVRLRLFEAANERGASVWLSALPLKQHGFNLHKGAFRDAICLKYGRRPPDLSMCCVHGKLFTVDHSLICPCDGLPILQHNDL